MMLAQKELKTMEQPRFKTAGDAALIIQWDLPPSPALTRLIAGLKFKLDERKDRGVIDTASAYTSLLLYYDPLTVEYNALVKEIRTMLRGDLSDDVTIGRNKTINIPVFYGDEYGPDLEYIAILKNMSVEEVIKIHCQAVYFVYMIGFLPGFPYLGFVDDRIATDRKNRPRRHVSAGSVGIAGRQTGIYSFDSPGGWQLLGRTPVKLFKPESSQFLFYPGDRVIFIPQGNGVRFSEIDPEVWSDLYGPGEGD